MNITRRGGAVRLSMSARVANDLGALQKGLGSLAERMGCPKCATGCDILALTLENDLTLGDAVALNPQPLPPHELRALAAGPLPDPWQVAVTLPDKVFNDIATLQRAVAVVVGRLGCEACCSGFDIQFRREIRTLALDEKLNVARFGGLG
jgi:hypothetical protein